MDSQQKEAFMALKVDLDCPRCYRKVKKQLHKFPQTHGQIYNEKQNTVTINVICSLCCKGGKSVKSIEILHPKPLPEKPADKPPPAPAPAPPLPGPADPKPAKKLPKQEPSARPNVFKALGRNFMKDPFL